MTQVGGLVGYNTGTIQNSRMPLALLMAVAGNLMTMWVAW